MAIKKKAQKFIGLLLDKTGSMGMPEKHAPTIVGFNTYLETVRSENPDAKFSLILFSALDTEKRYTAAPIADVKALSAASYPCSGSTNLFDAIADVITTIEAQAADLKNPEVLIVIQTDGEENASRNTTMKQVQDMIKAKQDAGWGFLFMGADIDNWDAQTVQDTFAIPKESVQMYTGLKSLAAFEASARASNRYMSGQRRNLFGDDKDKQ